MRTLTFQPANRQFLSPDSWLSPSKPRTIVFDGDNRYALLRPYTAGEPGYRTYQTIGQVLDAAESSRAKPVYIIDSDGGLYAETPTWMQLLGYLAVQIEEVK